MMRKPGWQNLCWNAQKLESSASHLENVPESCICLIMNWPLATSFWRFFTINGLRMNRFHYQYVPNWKLFSSLPTKQTHFFPGVSHLKISTIPRIAPACNWTGIPGTCMSLPFPQPPVFTFTFHRAFTSTHFSICSKSLCLTRPSELLQAICLQDWFSSLLFVQHNQNYSPTCNRDHILPVKTN